MWYELHLDTYHFQIQQQPGRFGILEWIKENILIDSTYNAAPASMKKMAENTFDIRNEVYPDYKVFIVLWDMRELWFTSPSKHLELNDSIIHADAIYCIWDEISPLFQALEVQSFEWPLAIFKKATDAWIALKKLLEETDDKYVILFKWSQNTIFTEEVLKAVLLNKEDENKLVRQSSDWMKKKNKFFAK
jgi:UDP-N-acetylmuramyl pentapeptide synthase